MKASSTLISLLEQVFASAFTFFLFVVATRLLSEGNLSLYTAYFSLNQSFAFFLMGLVLFPVASSTGEKALDQLGVSCVLLGVLLASFTIVSPIAMHMFASFEDNVNLSTWFLAVTFFSSQCLYETFRWLTIRMKGSHHALPITLGRFITFFAIIFYLKSNGLNALQFVKIQALINACTVIFYSFGLIATLKTIRLQIPDRTAFLHLSTFGNSVATFATNFTAVTLIDRAWGGAGLAAFQAIRSATNPIGLISQVIDNHISSDLARRGKNIALNDKKIALSVLLVMVIVACSVPFGPFATTLVLPDTFANWWPLFPMMIFASLAHAITRPIFVNWRLGQDMKALNWYSVLLMAIVLPGLFMMFKLNLVYVMIGLFAAQPLLCLFLFRRNQPSSAIR